MHTLRLFIFNLVSVSLISMGFAQVVGAEIIGTEKMLDSQNRVATIDRLEALVAKKEISQQLLAFGVQPEYINERIQGMTTQELLAMEGQLESQTAGAGILGVIGIVFVVLLILELVGVINIFNKV